MKLRLLGISLLLFLSFSALKAQEENIVPVPVQALDSLMIWADSSFVTPPDTTVIPIVETMELDDNQDDGVARLRMNSDLTSITSDAFFAPADIFRPSSRKAVLYSAMFPGLGQAYNRKYWKIPIIYGGFVGVTYAISWNNGYFRDYQAAFIDIKDGNPDTNRWHNFLPYGTNPADIDEQWFAGVLEQRRDFYRHYRDMSIIIAFGVYFLAMVDAYVDAQLFDFDMSPDLSLRVTPSVINNQHTIHASRARNSGFGLQMSFTF